jgi:hypothetical protein
LKGVLFYAACIAIFAALASTSLYMMRLCETR